MLKMVNILFIAFTIVCMVCISNAAILECEWSGEVCSKFLNMTPVTQPDEVVTINGKIPEYVNTETNYMSMGWDPSSTACVLNYVPTGIFTLFPNLIKYSTYKCATSNLITDSFKNCNNLNFIEILTGTITNIPYGFAQTCSNVTQVTMTSHLIRTIDLNALKGLTNLQALTLSNNKIECIPIGLFQSVPNIQSIQLAGNMITALDSGLFRNLPKFYSVDLSRNLLTFLPRFDMNGSSIDNLFVLLLRQNPITAINPDFASVLSSTYTSSSMENQIMLENLTCATNQFSYNLMQNSYQSVLTDFQSCFANWLPSMNTPVPCGGQLPTTILSTTLLPTTAVVTTPSPTPGSCPSDKVCRYFLDQYNRYTCILDGVDSVLTSISGNHLITFADSNVRRVIFTNSFLSRIPPILFQKFTSLEYLTVSNCSMSAINTNTFTACGSLKYFDASDNFITTVDGASFKSCASLEVIDLTGNSFDMISGQLFVNNPTLKAVYINRPPAMVLV